MPPPLPSSAGQVAQDIAEARAEVQRATAELAGMHDESAVRGAIEFLAAEGHLYSTIDESHYKSTGG